MLHLKLLPSCYLTSVLCRQIELTKLNHEHRELKDKLREEKSQVLELWRTRQELEEERKTQDRTVEQMQKKVREWPLSVCYQESLSVGEGFTLIEIMKLNLPMIF